MPVLRYLSHPDVVVDAEVPVPEWSLSDRGRTRAHAIAAAPWVAQLAQVVSSTEPKAVQTATMLAAAAGVEVEVRRGIAEIDRSSTGFLPHDAHDAQADRLFADPHESADGWERAIDAQHRMITHLADLLDSPHDVAVVGHGGVGTLWWCHLMGVDIERRHDQPHTGHLYDVDLATQRPTGPWRAFEEG